MRFLTAGESHGKCLMGILEGVPAGLKIDVDKINAELKRRQGGYGRGNRMKIETDEVVFLTGLRNFTTLGSPIGFVINNTDHAAWENIMSCYECDGSARKLTAIRPGHADYAGCVKYGTLDARNILERASARETATRVVIGAIAKQYLSELGIKVISAVREIGGIKAKLATKKVSELIEIVDKTSLRTTDNLAEEAMKKAIDSASETGDTLGGKLSVFASGMCVGVGSVMHYDRKLDCALSALLGSLQAVKSVSFGLGEEFSEKKGSESMDKMEIVSGKVTRKTNYAGGIEGGMSNGEDIVANITIKPIPSVRSGLTTFDTETKQKALSAPERSDVCVLPAAGVVCEAILAYGLMQEIDETFKGDTISEVKERFFARKAKENF